VIEQILGLLETSDREHHPSFLRTSDGREVDLLIDLGDQRWAIEIKLSSRPRPEDMRRLDALADWVDARRRILISRVSVPTESGRRISCDLPWLLENLARLSR
jgi:hypothetical protein